MVLGPVTVRPALAMAQGNGSMGFDLSPDGNDVLFSALTGTTRELSTVSLYGGEPRHLQAGAGTKVDPKWSPAGDLFAFTRVTDNRTPQVCVVPPTGGDPVPVAPDAGPSWQPEWAPEGDRLAFVAAPEGVPEVWVWTSENGTARAVAPGPAQGPTWSPDGSWICYLTGTDPEDLTLTYVSGWGGGAPRSLTPALSGISKPRWSPAGRQIAVTRAGGYRSVAIVSSATGRITPFAGSGLEQWDPMWSSNGTALAYRTRAAEGVSIELRPLTDGKPTPLARPDGLSTAPLFTPGKPRALYTWSRNNEPPELYVQIVAGGHPQRLTQTGIDGSAGFTLAHAAEVPDVDRAYQLGRPDETAVLWIVKPGQGRAWNPVIQDLAASGIATLIVELPAPASATSVLAAGVAYLRAAGAAKLALVLDGTVAGLELTELPDLNVLKAVAVRTPDLWPAELTLGCTREANPTLPLALTQSGLPALWLLAEGDPMQRFAEEMVGISLGRGQRAAVMALSTYGSLAAAAEVALAHESLVRFLHHQLQGGDAE